MLLDKAQLFELCETGLKAVGYDCVDVEYTRDQQGWVLRVFIDHPEPEQAEDKGEARPRQGITHEDCAVASHHLGTVLDVEEPIGNAYCLEMSSPGVRRPLHRTTDFEKYRGELVKIQMQNPVDGRRIFKGLIKSVKQRLVVVEVDNQTFELPLDGIKKARLEVEF